MNVFISGSTGSIGSVLLRMMLEKTTDNFYLLIRDSATSTGEQRMQNMLRSYYEENPGFNVDSFIKRIKVYSGNLSQQNFGLSDADYNEIVNNVDCIFHSAASLSFTQTLEDARNINCGGTKNVMALAEKIYAKGNLKRFHHVSTAYVCGTWTDHFSEDQLVEGQGFNNTYEQTKYESEIFVREYLAKGFPITVYRPSIVVADSNTGEITKSNIIFDFMRRTVGGKIKQVICDEDSSLNLVQMDYVVECMFNISQQPDSIGKTYNLTNSQNTRIRDFVSSWSKCGNVALPEFIPFAEIDKASSGTVLRLTPFLPYMKGCHTFDATNTLKATDIPTAKALTDGEIVKSVEFAHAHGLMK